MMLIVLWLWAGLMSSMVALFISIEACDRGGPACFDCRRRARQQRVDLPRARVVP